MKHRAVLLTWRDSQSYRGWNLLSDPDATEVALITTLGWIARETAREITVTTSITNRGSAMDMLTIPKEAIVKRKHLPQYVQGAR